MSFHIKLEFSDKTRINYELLKRQKLKTKEWKFRPINQILS